MIKKKKQNIKTIFKTSLFLFLFLMFFTPSLISFFNFILIGFSGTLFANLSFANLLFAITYYIENSPSLPNV